MRTNSAYLRRAYTLVAIGLVALTLSACNGTEAVPEEAARSVSDPTQTPAPSQASEPTQTPAPTQTLEPTQTPEPSQTPAPTHTAEPTQAPELAPDSSQMTLDEYAAFCAEFNSGETTEEEGEITYGEFSNTLSVLIGLLEPMNPPEELSDWHQALVRNQRALKTVIDEYPGSKDDPIDIEKIFELLMSYHEGLGEAFRAMDPALSDWLVAARCIDEEMARLYAEG